MYRSGTALDVVRSYLGYYAGSHQNSAAKRPWARIVLPWVTRWEVLVSYPALFLATLFLATLFLATVSLPDLSRLLATRVGKHEFAADQICMFGS